MNENNLEAVNLQLMIPHIIFSSLALLTVGEKSKMGHRQINHSCSGLSLVLAFAPKSWLALLELGAPHLPVPLLLICYCSFQPQFGSKCGFDPMFQTLSPFTFLIIKQSFNLPTIIHSASTMCLVLD